jgi:hypothetical protein
MATVDLRTAIKTGAYLLAKAHGLTADGAARLLGISPTGWKKKVGVADDADLGLDEVVTLTNHTGDFSLLDLAEGQVGRVAVPLPEASDGSSSLRDRERSVLIALLKATEMLAARPFTPATAPDFDAALLALAREVLGLRELVRRLCGSR